MVVICAEESMKFKETNFKHRLKIQNICRARHLAKPEMYLWEKMHLVDHVGSWALGMGMRRNRWFQMYKVSHLGK